MKKNGFIATSLIYSFFLIFITLFLSVIADYLQNRVLLNEIEKGIKSDINNTMGIRDFEVGDLLVFGDTGCSGNFDVSNAYVVANTNALNNELVLYSYSLCNSDSNNYDCVLNSNESILSGFSNISTWNQNTTSYNKIIYNFDKINSTSYKVGEEYYSLGNTNCDTNSLYNTDKGCKLSSGTSTYVRKEMTKTIDTRIEKCLDVNDFIGAIYLKGNL